MEKEIYCLLLIFICIISTSCMKSHPLPILTVEYKGENIDVVTGTYNWDFGSEAVCSDSPDPLDISKNMSGEIVVGGEYLELFFDNDPEEFDIKLWKENKIIEYSVAFNGSRYQIESPKEKGVHVFEVVGKWNRGTVTYVIKILVE